LYLDTPYICSLFEEEALGHLLIWWHLVYTKNIMNIMKRFNCFVPAASCTILCCESSGISSVCILGCLQVVLGRNGEETILVFFGVILHNFLESLWKITCTWIQRVSSTVEFSIS
jgi:hypothetical protein